MYVFDSERLKVGNVLNSKRLKLSSQFRVEPS